RERDDGLHGPRHDVLNNYGQSDGIVSSARGWKQPGWFFELPCGLRQFQWWRTVLSTFWCVLSHGAGRPSNRRYEQRTTWQPGATHRQPNLCSRVYERRSSSKGKRREPDLLSLRFSSIKGSSFLLVLGSASVLEGSRALAGTTFQRRRLPHRPPPSKFTVRRCEMPSDTPPMPSPEPEIEDEPLSPSQIADLLAEEHGPIQVSHVPSNGWGAVTDPSTLPS